MPRNSLFGRFWWMCGNCALRLSLSVGGPLISAAVTQYSSASHAKKPMHKSAIISDCGLYRYELRRVWDKSLPPYVSGMLNPSTADDKVDDATITRNIRRAQALGYGSLIVWNLGAGRATEPDNWKAMADPIGPENDRHIE